MSLVSALAWPLLYLAFLIVALYFTHRVEHYAREMGVGAGGIPRFLPAAGFLIMAAGGIVDSVAVTILGFRWSGLINYVLATPGSLLRLLTGYQLGALTMTILVTVAPFLPISLLIGGPTALLVTLLAALLSLAAGAAMLGLGALSAAATLMASRERMPLIWLLPFMVLVSAILYPPTLLPPLLRAVAPLIPLYHVSQALRQIAAYIEAEKLLTVLGVLAALGAGYSTLYAPASMLTREARRRSLD